MVIVVCLPLAVSGHDTGTDPLLGDCITGRCRINGSPVHQYLTREAADVWEGLPAEIRSHLSNSIYHDVDLPCSAHYDPDFDDIVTGSADEDQESYPYVCDSRPRYTNGFLEHFWDPDRPDFGGPGGYDKGFSDPNFHDGQEFASAYRKAQELWDTKVICQYTGQDRFGNVCPVDKDQAYYWLGRVVHLLEDLAVPAHAKIVSHDYFSGLFFGGRDPFEGYVGSVFLSYHGKDYRDLGAYLVEDLPGIALQEDFRWENINPEATDLFKLFWFTAQKTQYYATGGTILGRNGDEGTYYKLDGRPAQFRPSLWEIEGVEPIGDPADVPNRLPEMASALVPHALRAVAGLYRLFWQTIASTVPLAGGTYAVRVGGVVGTAFLYDPLQGAGIVNNLTMTGPPGWNGNNTLSVFRYQPEGTASHRSFFWNGVTPVTGVYNATGSAGTQAVTGTTSINAGSALTTPQITSVTATATTATINWTASTENQSFLALILPDLITSPIIQTVVGGATTSITFDGLTLTPGSLYHAMVFGMSQDVATPGPFGTTFNIASDSLTFTVAAR